MILKNLIHFFLLYFLFLSYHVKATQLICTAGQYYSFVGGNASNNNTIAACHPCNAGTYCSLAIGCLNNCTQCPPNSGSMSGASTCMGPFCQICPPGYFCGGGLSIQGCPVGTYSSATSLYSSAQCLRCAAGTFEPNIGATACANCSVGLYSQGSANTACLACSPGTFLTGTGFSTCSACTAGKFLTAVQASQPCHSCPSGTWQSGIGMSLCVLCVAGTYSTGISMINISSCIGCAPGTFSTSLGRNVTCNLCTPGSFSNMNASTRCDVCAIGTYASGNGSLSCIGCPPLTSTLSTGAIALDQYCLCNKGYTGDPLKFAGCTPCAPGTYKNFSGNGSCIGCPPMTYDATSLIGDRTTIAICIAVPLNAYSPIASATFYCNAGYFFDTTQIFIPQGTCTSCQANTFSYANSTVCEQCINALSASRSISIVNCSCLPGYYRPTIYDICIPCLPIRFYCPGANFQPQICRSLSQTQIALPSTYGDCICLPGTSGNSSGVCNACPIGFWCPGGSLQNPCPGNTSSPMNSTSISQCVCNPGYKPLINGLPSSACILCALNETCLSGLVNPCRPFSQTLSMGAFSQANCTCMPGYYSLMPEAPCQLCPANFYCPGNLALIGCMGNGTSMPGQSAFTACSCNAGFTFNNNRCNGCIQGSYCAGGFSPPMGCTPNANSPALASTATQCFCNAGYQGNYTLCSPCPIGAYAAFVNSSVCTLCLPGQYGKNIAVISSTAACFLCDAGTYSTELGAQLLIACKKCQAGTYSTTLGASDSSTCILCKAGTYSTVIAALNSSTCLLCQAGKYSTTIGAPDPSSFCLACAAGFYSTTLGAAFPENCIECPKGTYTFTTSTTSVHNCLLCTFGKYASVPTSQCQSCPLGTYSLSQGLSSSVDACILCSPGTYQSLLGLTSCIACSPGSFTTAYGNNDASLCINCIPSTYTETFASTTCIECPLGTWGSAIGGTSLSLTCISCERGTYANTSMSTAMRISASNTCIPCGTGTYGTVLAAINSNICILCMPGTYSMSLGASTSSTCIPCVSGSYSAFGSSICQYCAGGRYIST